MTLWTYTTLTDSATAAAWFSIFRLNPLVSRVNRRIPIRIDKVGIEMTIGLSARGRWFVIGGVLTLSGLSLALLTTVFRFNEGGAVQPKQAPDDRILFEALPQDSDEPAIFLANPDGTSVQQLTRSGVSASSPSWSPDHSQIAFQSDLEERDNTDIYTMKSDGSEIARVTKDPAIDSGPVWSPTGDNIVFERSDSQGNVDLYVIAPGGDGETRLTDAKAISAQPSWSPDGTRIVFMRNSNGNGDIYVLDLKTGTELQLTSSPTPEDNPAWSPDGTQIAFNVENGEGSCSDIYVMNSHGSDVRQLTTDKGDEANPVWSPDGRQLLFVAHSPVDLEDLSSPSRLQLEVVNLQDKSIASVDLETLEPAGPFVSW